MPPAGAGGGNVLLPELWAASFAGGTFLARIAFALASSVCFVALLQACCACDFFFFFDFADIPVSAGPVASSVIVDGFASGRNPWWASKCLHRSSSVLCALGGGADGGLGGGGIGGGIDPSSSPPCPSGPCVGGGSVAGGMTSRLGGLASPPPPAPDVPWRYGVGGHIHALHCPLHSSASFVRLAEKISQPFVALVCMSCSCEGPSDDGPTPWAPWSRARSVRPGDVAPVDLPVPRECSSIFRSSLLDRVLVVGGCRDVPP